jgi:hypothetical protein
MPVFEIDLNDRPIRATVAIMPKAVSIGKRCNPQGETLMYWYVTKSGCRMAYLKRDQFRYALRNNANVKEAYELVDELDKAQGR